MVAALGLTAYYGDPVIPIASMAAVLGLTYVFRQLGWTRAPFNDLKNKRLPKYKEFFKRYCASFRDVFAEIYAPIERGSVPSRDGVRPSDRA